MNKVLNNELCSVYSFNEETLTFDSEDEVNYPSFKVKNHSQYRTTLPTIQYLSHVIAELIDYNVAQKPTLKTIRSLCCGFEAYDMQDNDNVRGACIMYDFARWLIRNN